MLFSLILCVLSFVLSIEAVLEAQCTFPDFLKSYEAQRNDGTVTTITFFGETVMYSDFGACAQLDGNVMLIESNSGLSCWYITGIKEKEIYIRISDTTSMYSNLPLTDSELCNVCSLDGTYFQLREITETTLEDGFSEFVTPKCGFPQKCGGCIKKTKRCQRNKRKR